MNGHDDNLDKYYGQIFIKEGQLCPECKEIKNRFDYATICNDCYIKMASRNYENREKKHWWSK
jgi:hypothetical protein